MENSPTIPSRPAAGAGRAPLVNRTWLLRRYPEGALTEDDFTFQVERDFTPALQEGEILVHNEAFACAPTIRNYLYPPGRSYHVSIAPGDPVAGPACGRVVESRHPGFPAGSLVAGMSSWQDYSVLAPDTLVFPIRLVPGGVSAADAMGRLSLNSLTGYMGMTRIGRPVADETVVVSAAAGSTGSIAAQVARIMGCRVIGIAGSDEKCAWLTGPCGLAAAINYRTEDVRARLAELCPSGIDVFFDNVGGDILQAVMDNIAVHGRIVACGQISAYDSDRPAPGPQDMMKVVYWRVRIEGFILSDFGPDLPEAQRQLREWSDAGLLVTRIDERRGLENLPRSFLDLFTGGNKGALLVSNEDPAP